MRVQFAARGHMCKLYVLYKNMQQYKRLGSPRAVFFTSDASEPAHNNDCGPLPKEVTRPWFRSAAGCSVLIQAVSPRDWKVCRLSEVNFLEN